MATTTAAPSSAPTAQPRLVSLVIAVVATAALVWFGTGMFPLWPLLWLAPVPVLVVAARSPRKRAALVAWLAMLCGLMSYWRYFVVLGLPIGVRVAFLAGTALVFMGCVGLFRTLVRRGAYWTALVGFPAAFVAYEYVTSLVSPHGTAFNFAYTQLNCLPVLQLASLTGPWGISFVLLLFPAALALAWLRRDWRFAAAGAAVVTAVVAFGCFRLVRTPAAPTVRVGLIASDTHTDIADNGAATDQLVQQYTAQAEALAQRGAKIIVLPEKIGVVSDLDLAPNMFLGDLALRTRTTIIAGVVKEEGPYNRALVWSPSDLRSYDKWHMLPPFESKLKPGTRITQLADRRMGVAICKDMDFTRPARDYGEERTALLLVPAWDFGMDRWWHGHIAVMRGVENGYAIARAARGGFLTVSDDRGRILGETRSDSAPFAEMVIDVPVRHDDTVYLRFGDWFAFVALGLLAGAIVRLFFPLTR